MKALSKPLSSPGRADKFPPPLMRFLRSNVGSRSRGRSRSSPLFYLRSRKSVPIETTQEPSSPKVTCIGQVRVRRRSTTATKKSKRRPARRRRWTAVWWVKKSLCCETIPSRPRKKNPVRRWFCKCSLIFRFGYCKKVDSKEDSLNEENVGVEDKRDFSCNKKEENFVDSGCSSCPPPKNALILTRCRSAPYRSSSLGGRFWGSPLVEEANRVGNSCNEEEKTELRISGEGNTELVGDSDTKEGTMVMLTRCKSEPARTGERLVPESILPRIINS